MKIFSRLKQEYHWHWTIRIENTSTNVDDNEHKNDEKKRTNNVEWTIMIPTKTSLKSDRFSIDIDEEKRGEQTSRREKEERMRSKVVQWVENVLLIWTSIYRYHMHIFTSASFVLSATLSRPHTTFFAKDASELNIESIPSIPSTYPSVDVYVYMPWCK